VIPDRRHAQPAEVGQFPAITAAGAGGSNGMKGSPLIWPEPPELIEARLNDTYS
jgi:hypothetical protein